MKALTETKIDFKSCYICGPMRGIDLLNWPEFDRAAELMRGLGVEVVSPADLDRDAGFDPTMPMTNDLLHQAMRRDIEALLHVDALVLLPGWAHSKGAQVEINVAHSIGLSIHNVWEFE